MRSSPFGAGRYLYQYRLVVGLLHDDDWVLTGQVKANSHEEALQRAREECKARAKDIPQWRQNLLPHLNIEVKNMGPTAL